MEKTNKARSIFFANLFGIIVGIILTFGVNAFWQKFTERKKTLEILGLIRNELEINREWLVDQEKTLKKHSHYYKKLLEADKKWETIPEDSLINYANIVNLNIFTYSTSAWQIFQSSETFQKMTDKELIIRLNDCYFNVNTMYDVIMKNYWDKKMDEMPIEYLGKTNEFFNELMNNKKESLRFLEIAENTNFWSALVEMQATIDYSILLLDNYNINKYDREEKDKKFESFVEERIDKIYQDRDTVEIYKVTDEELDQFLGVYSSSQINIIITITKENGKLICEVEGQPSLILKATEKNKFKNAKFSLSLEFNPTDKTMILKQAGGIYDFVKKSESE